MAGSGVLNLQGPEISLDNWHSLHIIREGQSVTLTVDDIGIVQGSTPGTNTGLTLNSVLWVGGVPDFSTVQPQAEFQTGFGGCIQEVKVSGWNFICKSNGFSAYTSHK